MQAYEGYFEQGGRFIPLGMTKIPERKRTIVTILDEQPAQDEAVKTRLAAIDEFFEAIRSCDEPVPEFFERVQFREIEV